MEFTLGKKIKRFYEPAALRKKEHIKYVIQQIIISFSSLLGVIFLERIITSLSRESSEGFLFNLVLYGVLLICFEIVIFVIRKWGWMNTLPFNIVDIYDKYLGRYLEMDNNSMELLGTGKVIGIVNEGAKVWSSLIADSVIKITQLIVTIGFTLFMISRVSYVYVIVFLLLILVSFMVIFYVNKLQAVFRARRYEYRNTRMKQFVKVVMSKMEILQAGKFDVEIEAMYGNTHKISNVSKDMATYRIILKRSASFLVSLVLIVLFYVLGKDILSGGLDIGILVGISGTLIIMQRAITDAMSFYIDFSKEFISVEKLWDFFDMTPQIVGYEEGKIFKHKAGSISLRNIHYGYDASKPVFQNFTLDIPGNQITALVGPSGGGKSTLAKLIAGYIRHDSGDICIDNQNLREVSLRSYYGDVGYLTQEPSVFDGTVEENLLYAVTKKLSKTHVENIIKLAHCEFIYDLPNGLQTEIGERGVKLSGGQKQRLAIAKIFLKDPKIIILDEPTSALDSLSEQKITEAMHNLFEGRTVIVIAHRLQTVKHADDIIVIEGGGIRERGTHNSLVRKKGFYKQMLDLQSGF